MIRPNQIKRKRDKVVGYTKT